MVASRIKHFLSSSYVPQKSLNPTGSCCCSCLLRDRSWAKTPRWGLQSTRSWSKWGNGSGESSFTCVVVKCVVAPLNALTCGRRLKELLRAKLVECGWKDQLKAHCKGMSSERMCAWAFRGSAVTDSCFRADVIKEKGLEHVTVEDLVTEVTPKGRGTGLCMLSHTIHTDGGQAGRQPQLSQTLVQ